jgi:hypothetical protein
VLVLPAAAGGYANGALAPASRRPVEDIACDIRAATDATVSPVAVRLTDEALNAAGLHPGQILRQAWRCEAAGTGVGLDELCELLGQAGERLRALGAFELRRVTDDAEPLGDLDVADLYEDSPDFFEDPDQEGLEGERPLFEEEALAERSAFVLLTRARITREELRPPGERPPTLQDHANAVAERAAGYLTRSGLPDPVAAAVVLAARVHDHGKADPRFQSFFRGGVTAFLETPIAKSVFGTADAQASRAARAAAGLPRGLRHEIASVAALEGWDQGARTVATDHTAPA